VACADRARAILGWQPQFDDLATIVRHALAWERRLAARGGTSAVKGQQGGSAEPSET
jgi:UDP-glucose 4-epimerase